MFLRKTRQTINNLHLDDVGRVIRKSTALMTLRPVRIEPMTPCRSFTGVMFRLVSFRIPSKKCSAFRLLVDFSHARSRTELTNGTRVGLFQ